jgi:hypothetical protein
LKALLQVAYALSLFGIWGCLFFYGRVAWNLGKAFWQAGVEGLLQYSLIANWPGFNGQQKLIAVVLFLLPAGLIFLLARVAEFSERKTMGL